MEKLPLIIAHRGESFDAPENTLASVNLAWERKVEAVEVDVRLSLDNNVVVIHDKTTKRVGNVHKKVKKQTLAELKQLDVGSWKSEKYNNEKIPTLIEVLNTVPTGKKIIIEIKSSDKIIPSLIDVVKRSGLKVNQVEFISFKYEVITQIKKELPQYKSLLLADLDYSWMTKVFSPSAKELIDKVKQSNLDGINVWAGKLLTERFVYDVKWENLLLYTWTVDKVNKAKELADWHVDAVTTNKAAWMKKELSNY